MKNTIQDAGGGFAKIYIGGIECAQMEIDDGITALIIGQWRELSQRSGDLADIYLMGVVNGMTHVSMIVNLPVYKGE